MFNPLFILLMAGWKWQVDTEFLIQCILFYLIQGCFEANIPILGIYLVSASNASI